MVERWGWFVPLYYRWLQHLAVAILVPSQSAADGYIKRGVREQHIRVMPNALDMARFERVDADRTFRRLRSQLGIPQEAYVIGTVCRLEKIKGIQLLIKAIQKLPVYLIIVGDGPERASLSALASELEISETIRFLGTRSDVPDLLNTFDLFVLPSYSESFGIVVAEALLTATPVVATRTGGIPDVTGEGQYAYLIPPGDEESLTSAISWMMEHPEEARKQALGGKRFVCHTFSLDVVVEKQHAMYQRCMRF
jgi:glycosyltransferase involved in cell wall biosynthesis